MATVCSCPLVEFDVACQVEVVASSWLPFITGPTRWSVGWDPKLASYYAQVEPSVLPPPVTWWDPSDPGYDDPLEDVVGYTTG